MLLSNGNLLVANAHKTDSSIMLFGGCDGSGQRQFISDFITTDISHPYGLALGAEVSQGGADVIWVSNQDTFDVTQFGAASGAFQQQVKQFGSEELRSLAYDQKASVLYVANENEDAVLAYDTKSDTWSTSTHSRDSCLQTTCAHRFGCFLFPV